MLKVFPVFVNKNNRFDKAGMALYNAALRNSLS
jgi:hypothetical protein